MPENAEDTKLIKGFNAGYQLSKHEPGLFKLITKQAQSSDPYMQGLLLGGQEYDREKARELIKTKKKDSDLDRSR